MKRTKNLTCSILIVLFLTTLVGAILLGLIYFPSVAAQLYGAPDPALGYIDRIMYSVRLVFGKAGLLEHPAMDPGEREFIVNPGESASLITLQLEQEGFIPDAELLRIYLIYSGLDKRIQSGTFLIQGDYNPVEIAQNLQDATPATITFGILPGWRVEEVAASLATSGLQVTSEDLLNIVGDPSSISIPASLGQLNSLEGFLYPAQYEFPREITLPDMVIQILEKFSEVITSEMIQGFSSHGLTLQQAVTLASIVQREAVHEDEMPLISSVFYNRLAIGMKLDSDPTVQYALGYSDEQQSIWKNPLTTLDLQIDSPYNTYLHPGLPPSPICNPGLAALEAVAFPAESDFLYFRSNCDGSGYHNFARTYEEHLGNSCP